MTLNNYNDIEHQQLVDRLTKLCEYAVIGREVGEGGTPHLQMCCEFKNMKSMKQIKSLNERMHIETRKGTKQQAATYCKKDGDFVEIGELKTEQGKRNDLNSIKDAVKEGKNMREICEITNSFQAIRFAETLKKYNTDIKRTWKTETFWFYGPTGTGKTRRAWDMANPDDCWESMNNLKWWDGYDGQADVILDDIRKDDIPINYLLKIIDRYPLKVEYKGGSTPLLARRIFITSDRHPEEFYFGASVGDIRQLLRRINHIHWFNGNKCDDCERDLHSEELCDCAL